jgi:hypothetical protein
MSCIKAKSALPAGGAPHCQRLSLRRRPPQSKMMKGRRAIVVVDCPPFLP